MIYLTLSTLAIIPILIGIGTIVKKIFRISTWQGISGELLLGIMGLSILWTTLAFFTPINEWIEICCALIGWCIFLYSKKYVPLLSVISKNKFIFTIGTVIILFVGSGYPFILDFFGYYLPSIQWIKKIGLVKGIANLDLILGQMSIWHIFQSGFSHFFDPYLRLNAIVLLSYLIYILERKAWRQLVILPFLFFFIQSPSPDLPVIIGALVLVNEFIKPQKNNTLFLWYFSIFIFCIKPTALWLPLMVFLKIILKKQASWKYLGGLTILFIFFIKNLWCFGYPIFPVQIGDLSLPWKPNIYLLNESSKIAILKTYDLQYTYEEISQFGFLDYIYNWLSLSGIKGIIHIIFTFCLAILIGFAYYSKDLVIRIIIFSILIKSILVLTFSAQYRFFLEVFFVCFLLISNNKTPRNKNIIISGTITISILIILLFPSSIKQMIPSFKLGQMMKESNFKQLICPSTYHKTSYRKYRIGNLDFNVSNTYPFSYTAPIPAISPSFLHDYYKANIFPQKIGQDLRQGFVWKPLSKTEKKKLSKILIEINQIEK